MVFPAARQASFADVRSTALHVAKIGSLWIVGDVVYALLPVAVLAVITLILAEPFDHFWRIKEWSFATIVFFGAALRRFVRLKTRQRTHRSFKLDLGIQLFIAGLIGAVLVLTFVVLEEKRILTIAASNYLAALQFALFVTGLLSLLVCVCAEQAARDAMHARSHHRDTAQSSSAESAIRPRERIQD